MGFEINTHDSDIDPEINHFLQNDGEIDSGEARILLEEAENAKNKILHVSAENLEKLREAILSSSRVGALSETDKTALQGIIDESKSKSTSEPELAVSESPKESTSEPQTLEVGEQESYLTSDGKLDNVNLVSLKTIIKDTKNQEIINLIGDPDKFSITDKKGIKNNVVWSDNRNDYLIEGTNKRALIFNGYELGEYNQIEVGEQESYLTSDGKLDNVNLVSLKTIIKDTKNQEIINLIGDPDKFSITDKKGIKNNVVWSDNRNDYLIEGTNKRALIFNGYELGEYDSAIKSKESVRSNIELTNNELTLLAALVKAEAGGESRKGKVAVINVILNRMKIRGQSLKNVVYAKNQFSPVSDGRLSRVLNGGGLGSYKKLIRSVLSGKIANPISDATFFQTLKVDNQRPPNWQKRARHLEVTAIIGDHVFRRVT